MIFQKIYQFETLFNGWIIKASQEDQKFKIQLKSRQTGKKYTGNYDYDSQGQVFQFAFTDVNDFFKYFEESISLNNQMVKISQNGQIEVGTKINKNKIRYLKLATQQVQEEESGRLLQITSFMKKDIKLLQDQIQLLKQIIKNMKDQFNGKLDNNKKQAFENAQNLVNDLALKFDEKLAENQRKFLQSTQVLKNQTQNKFQTEQQINQQKLLQITKLIQQIIQKQQQLSNALQIQLEKQHEMMDQDKNLNREIQKNKKNFQLHLQKYEIKQIFKTDKNISLTLNTQTQNFKTYYKLRNGSQIQRIKEDNNNDKQLVSNQILPQNGCYKFKVKCFATNKNSNSVFIGIQSINCKNEIYVHSNKEAIGYQFKTGDLWRDGSNSKKQNILTLSQNTQAILTIVVNLDQKKITWFIDNKKAAQSNIPEALIGKKHYAFITTCYVGTVYQFLKQ